MGNIGARIAGCLLVVGLCLVERPAVTQNLFAEPDVTVLYTLQSGIAGDNFGFVAETIGDIDGDAAPDFLIGAPADSTLGPVNGAVYVYSGRTGTLIRKVRGARFNRFGFAVSAAGDVDADGTADYVVGAPGVPFGPSPQIGRVVVMSGATHQPIVQTSGRHHLDFLGFDVNAAGDLNGDGVPDVVGGARHFRDATFIDRGYVVAISGLDGSRIWTSLGQQAGAFLGAGVSGIADVTGDDVPDVAAGASGDGPQGGGRAYIFSGVDGSTVRTLTPNGSSATQFGEFFVHDAGDVDADGVHDVYVGDFAARKNGIGFGQAYVFSGATGERARTFIGEPGDSLGDGRGIGDVDGDGHADLLIASFTNGSAAPGGGKLQVFSGKNGHVLRTMTGAVQGKLLGFDVVGIGDVNGDGKTDILVTGAGIAHVIAGKAP